MFFLTWLPRLLSPRSSSRRAGRKARARRPPFRPGVAVLEDRLVPALLTVNSLTDAPPSGLTSTLTLREAVALVNSGGTAADSAGNSLGVAKTSQIDATNPFGSKDAIQFAPGLFGTGQQQITLAEGTLLLTRGVTVDGPGAARLALGGNGQRPVLEVAAGAVVGISGLTVGANTPAAGTVSTGNIGGGIVNYGVLILTDGAVTDNTADLGGGVANFGTLTLADSTVADNSALLDDGGILNMGTLTLIDSTVSGNTAAVGNGGIASYGGTVTLLNSVVSGNAAQGGGGIGNYGGTLTLTGSTVFGNSSDSGGGILNTGALAISDSTIAGNTAEGGGGGILNLGTLTLAESTVSGNTAIAGGGLANNGTLVVEDSTVSGNAATLNDGGIANTGTLALTDSVVSGNTAVLGNGGIANYGGAVTLTGSTVFGNTAVGAGGIGNYGGTLTLTDSVVSGNAAAAAAGILNEATLTVTDSTVSDNSAALANGGIFNAGTLALVGSTVSGNAAQQEDGGIGNTGTLAAFGSVVAGNSGGDLTGMGTVDDLGDNLIASTPATPIVLLPALLPDGGFTQTSAALTPGDFTLTWSATGPGTVVGMPVDPLPASFPSRDLFLSPSSDQAIMPVLAVGLTDGLAFGPPEGSPAASAVSDPRPGNAGTPLPPSVRQVRADILRGIIPEGTGTSVPREPIEEPWQEIVVLPNETAAGGQSVPAPAEEGKGWLSPQALTTPERRLEEPAGDKVAPANLLAASLVLAFFAENGGDKKRRRGQPKSLAGEALD